MLIYANDTSPQDSGQALQNSLSWWRLFVTLPRPHFSGLSTCREHYFNSCSYSPGQVGSGLAGRQLVTGAIN